MRDLPLTPSLQVSATPFRTLCGTLTRPTTQMRKWTGSESSDNLAIVHTLLDGVDRPDFVELVHRLDQGDASGLAEFTTLFELVDPEIVWDTSALEIPDLGLFHGHEGMITWWRKWLAAWEGWSFEAKNFEEIRDQVVFDVVVRGRSRRMGAYAEFPQAHVVTLRAGKVVACRVFKDRPEALAVT
jgi:ketosteroid isomerase-like protein